TFRGFAKNANHEKLNDERGIKPLPVSRSRDGAESGKLHRKDRSPLLYSRDRNQCVVAHWKLCRDGSFGHTCQFGPNGPTNVTAVAKIQTNRARSVATGLVSGAGFSVGDSNAAL